MAVEADALTTLVAAKRHLGIPTGTTTYDAQLEVLIDAATDCIESYCSRKFASATYTDEAYDGNGGTVLYLNQYPATALTSLRSDGDTIPVRPSVTGDGYVLELKSGRIDLVGYTFDEGVKNIQVTYTAGYIMPAASQGRNLPKDLEQACILLVAQLFEQPNPNVVDHDLGAERKTFRTFVTETLPPVIRIILDKYRKPISV